MKYLFVAIAVAGLAACSSVTPITPAGKDTYIVGSKVRGGLSSWTEVKANALQQATDFCTKQGKQMEQVDMQTHGVRSLTPQEAELTFKCT